MSDLALATESDPRDGALTAEALSASDGSQAGPTTVRLYRELLNGSPPRLLETQRTGSAGKVRFAARGHGDGGEYFLIAQRGSDLALTPESFSLGGPAAPATPQNALIFTDRSVYRPGQTLFWKVVAYRDRPAGAPYEALPSAELTIRLRDANNQVVMQKRVRTDDFGAAAGDFAVPTGRLLGCWRLETSRGGAAPVSVEEYKRPTFEVTLKAPEAPPRLDHPATLRGEARYYFGLPLARGSVRWQITREPFFAPGLGEMPRQRSGSLRVASGQSAVASDGSLSRELHAQRR